MPSKKKSKRKPKAKTAKRVSRRSVAKKSVKKSAKKKVAKKPAAKAKARSRKKRTSVSAEAELKREFQRRKQSATGRSAARRSEDFAGLSQVERADSESVDELVEEGNVAEAGVVAGVEEADDSDEREVHTHEVPEDDVPEEYDQE